MFFEIRVDFIHLGSNVKQLLTYKYYNYEAKQK